MELHLSSKPRLHKRPESDIAIIVPVIEPVHATTLRHTMIDQSINLLSRRSRQRERLYAKGLCICLSVCLFVCPSVAKMRTQKCDFLKNQATYNLVTIDELQEVLHGLFKELTTGPLQFKMAEKNREIVISQRNIIRFRLNLVENSTLLDDSHMIKYEHF